MDFRDTYANLIWPIDNGRRCWPQRPPRSASNERLLVLIGQHSDALDACAMRDIEHSGDVFKLKLPIAVDEEDAIGADCEESAQALAEIGENYGLGVDVDGAVLLNAKYQVLRVRNGRLVFGGERGNIGFETDRLSGEQHEDDQEYQQDIDHRSDVDDGCRFVRSQLHRHG